MSNARKFCIGYLVGIIALGLGRLIEGDTPAVALNPLVAGIAIGLLSGCFAVAWYGDSKCD